MAKIAAAVERALAERRSTGGPGCARARIIARGEGWTVADVVCTSGPADRPFEEQHASHSIAIVAAGTFQYRSAAGRHVMTPGSMLLGRAGACYECGHEHASGDRCVSFWFEPASFEQLAADVGARSASIFGSGRLPALRETSPLVAAACAGLSGAPIDWHETATQLAATVLRLDAGGGRRTPPVTPAVEGRVTDIVRRIEACPDRPWTLARMAREAGLSAFHFLRVFEQATGLTPHQFLLRTRLRAAAARLTTASDRVVDVALESGFGDVSNFNRMFRAEFGASPNAFRRSPA